MLIHTIVQLKKNQITGSVSNIVTHGSFIDRNIAEQHMAHHIRKYLETYGCGNPLCGECLDIVRPDFVILEAELGERKF